jgi:HEPN domain-containing protein
MTGKRREEATRWFQQALYDLKAALWNLEGGFYNTTCFLAQQCGEKALKALLYREGARRKAIFTHSLVEMLRELQARSLPEIDSLLEEGRLLDLHYIPSRYPNGLPSGYPYQFYGKKTAEQAIAAAEKVFNTVQEYFRSQGEIEIIRGDG